MRTSCDILIQNLPGSIGKGNNLLPRSIYQKNKTKNFVNFCSKFDLDWVINY